MEKLTVAQNNWLIMAGALLIVYILMFFNQDLLAAAFIFGVLAASGIKTWSKQW